MASFDTNGIACLRCRSRVKKNALSGSGKLGGTYRPNAFIVFGAHARSPTATGHETRFQAIVFARPSRPVNPESGSRIQQAACLFGCVSSQSNDAADHA